MTAINLKNLIEIAQRKIAVVDSNSSTRDLENLMEITMLTGGGHKADSAGFDSDVPGYVGRVVFIDSGSEGFFKFNQTIAGAPSATPSQNFTQIIQGGTYTSAPPGAFTGQAFIEGYNIQGDTYGYRYGGSSPPYGVPYDTTRFSFTSDGNAATVPALTGSPTGAGTGDRTSYTSHQYLGISSTNHFPFANEDGWTANDITAAPTGSSYFGHAQASATHVYLLGGATPINTNFIEKYPVAAIATGAQAVDVGNLSVTMGYSMGGEGASSETHCYRVGGFKVPGYNAGPIQKVAYASDGDATQPGNPTSGGYNLRQNCSSPSHGYAFGGAPNGGSAQNIIEKWSFTSDGDATDVGDLTGAVQGSAGATSTTHGYRTGGYNTFASNAPAATNIIDKFAFASDGNATDVGDLVAKWVYGAGANE